MDILLEEETLWYFTAHTHCVLSAHHVTPDCGPIGNGNLLFLERKKGSLHDASNRRDVGIRFRFKE